MHKDLRSRVWCRNKNNSGQNLRCGCRGSENSVVCPFRIDFFLKIGILPLKPVAQLRNLLQSVSQLWLIFLTLRNTAENNHCSGKNLMVVYGGLDISYAAGLSIFSPKHLVLYVFKLLKPERFINWAIMMVNDGVDGFTKQIFGRPPQHFLVGAVYKSRSTFCIQTVNAPTGRVQDKLVPTHQVREQIFGAYPFI